MPRKKHSWLGLLQAFLTLVLLAGCLNPAPPTLPPWEAPLDFGDLPAIWPAGAGDPGAMQVALFRCRFESNGQAASRLEIFADTRYEAWIDGQFLGRGPARFSSSLREFDSLDLPPLSQGEHQLAVLVEWAPNGRRSESLRPILMSQLVDGERQSAVCRTGTGWKASLSDAWRLDAAPVHSQGTIGPTELHDFRKLPDGWNLSGFDDSGWQAAAVVDESDLAEITYHPRSIDFLASYPTPFNVIDSGHLSPGLSLLEWNSPGDHRVDFELDGPEIFVMEALSGTYTAPLESIMLDGASIEWQKVGDDRPDVYSTSLNLASGAHSLSLSDFGETGASLAVSNHFNIDPVLEPGSNAGRLTLLADPVSDPQAVSYSGEATHFTFKSLPAYVVLDLGRTIHGRLAAQVSGPSGVVVTIGWDERLLDTSARPLPFPGSLHAGWNQVDSWTLEASERVLSTLDARAGRYILIEVWGEGPVTLNNLQVVEERYPLTLQGNFRSSDPNLDRLWQASVVTLYPNMTDAYTDTPWRERGQWWGDAYIEVRANRVTFGDPDLLRRGLELMALEYQPGAAPGRAPTNGSINMMDYFMLWVHDLADYQRLSPDPALLETAYPVVAVFMQQLQGWQNPQTGLLDLPQTDWSQTVYIDTYGLVQRYGQSTAVNALYYSTLLRASELALLQGEDSSAAQWQAQAQSVRQSANNLLYLPDQGLYLTHVYQGEQYPPTPQAQAWALEFGLAPDGEERRIGFALIDLLELDSPEPVVSVYAAAFVLDALGKSGMVSQGLDVLRTYYLPVIDSGSPTFWENWFADDFYSQSLSHGWGSAPAWFLSTYLLGARQEDPSTWSVTPALTGVDSVSGAVPFNGGLLEVAWESRGCEQRWLTTASTVPGQGLIRLTAVGFDQISLDGEIVWQAGKPLSPQVNVSGQQISISVDHQPHRLELAGCMP